MKPILIQNLIKHYKNRKPKHLEKSEIDSVHGGHRDRSGFMVLLILLVMIIVAFVLS